MKLGPSAGWRWWATATAGMTVGMAAGWLLFRELADADHGLSLAPLRRLVASEAGSDRIRVRRLGEGIVELVGPVDDPELASRLLDEAAAVEGVDVVVNRLWGGGRTPSEGRNRPIDAPSGPR